MCGIAGFFESAGGSGEEMIAVLSRMTAAIAHRGPDDTGTWVDAQAGVALGHRRLSIVDLSPQGHQPMLSASGRFVIIFNGEVYNHKAIRAELEKDGAAPPWRGHSDTEVMLAAVERWGVDGALSRFNGMFAFALWDRREQVLHLARDRLGEKPLYVGWSGRTLLFGSELKALRAHPAWRAEIDPGATALYMRHACVPAPYSIYKNIRKLMPAQVLSIPLSTAPGEIPSAREYWSARAAAETGSRNPLAASESEVISSLDALLRDAVALRMEADVPLGAFLSGGVDSSVIVALMQVQSSRPIRTFSIGFNEAQYNEAEHAKAVSQHLGTEHTELYVTPEEALAVIPLLPTMYDEPFADSSQIPTHLVSKMTRRHVTVALSGDGGDELFGGYVRYFMGTRIWKRLGWMPSVLRSALATGLTSVSPAGWNRLGGSLEPVMPRSLRARHPGDKLHKLAGVLRSGSSEELYRGLVTFWDPADCLLDPTEPRTALTDASRMASVPDFARRMMYLDLISYLPDDPLVKLDRASMAVSLESRVPLLDHRVVELAWKLPADMRIRNGEGKWALRQVLYRYVPRAMIERPKMGFGVPIDEWLRGPLQAWAEGLLERNRLERDGVFKVDAVRTRWREHLSGQRNWSYPLWNVLMFQAWRETA